METNAYDREKLYEEIWKEPMTKVAVRYNVSASALKKMCNKLNIPTAPPGHWSKIKAGQKIKPPKLPKLKVQKNVKKPSVENNKKRKLVSDDITITEDVIKYIKKVRVRKRLHKPDKLLENTIDYYKGVEEGIKTRQVLKVDAHDNSRRRIYLYYNTLIKAFSHLGCKVDIITSDYGYRHYNSIDYNNLYITKGLDQVSIEIKEIRKKAPKKSKNNNCGKRERHVYTGKLSLEISGGYYKKVWSDDECMIIEDRVNGIIMTIFETLSKVRLDREKYEEMCKIKEEEEQKCLAIENRKKEELEKVNNLISVAEQYAVAEKVNNYIAALEATVNMMNDELEVEKIKNYIEWAKQKVEYLNPLIRREDEILGRKE